MELNINKNYIDLLQSTNFSKSILEEGLIQIIQNLMNINNEKKVYIKLENVEEIILNREGYYLHERKENNPLINKKYTLLLGLTESSGYNGKYLTLWKKLNDNQLSDYHEIISTKDEKALYKIFQKNNIPFYSIENLYQSREQISNFVIKSIPKYFDFPFQGRALFFEPDVYHTAEKLYNFEKEKKLLLITLDLESVDKVNDVIEIYPLFQDWMLNYTKENNVIPFQIVFHEGKYNDKDFSSQYIYFWNFNNDIYQPLQTFNFLEEVMEIDKKRNQGKYRQDFLSSISMDKKIDNKMYFQLFEKNIDLNIEKMDLYKIENFAKNLKKNITSVIKIHEVLKNTYEDRDDDDIWEDETTLKSEIFIIYGFYKK